MENQFLQEAKALYKDRIRIVLSALIIVFSITFFLYYTSGIAGLGQFGPPDSGWTRSIQVVASFNNVGLILAISLLAIVFRFWSWAFLPGPASFYTLSVLRGILGSKASVKQTIGKRFRIILENGMTFRVSCQIKEKGTDDWFSYRLVSSVLQHSNLKDIALRHGFSVRDNKFVASVSHDELHHRTLLLTKAMMIATPVV
ncbi:MAG: hypothetical protein ACW96M_04550 [Candidatus Thorarchaeota archaeon]|jgi:hypothetical protein